RVSGVSVLVFLYFFFFQAEDGIRDFHVTGVQTCALPIWNPSDHSTRAMSSTTTPGRVRRLPWPISSSQSLKSLNMATALVSASRSEERRVGKECRSRWWPDP